MPRSRTEFRQTPEGRTSDTDRIDHLFRRAGFGASEEEINRYAQLGYEATVDSLLSYQGLEDLPDPTSVLPNFDSNRLASIQLLWLYRMVNSPRPLEERMTLFWHNHFATANSKVNNPVWMWNQNELFRKNALGNFRQLVQQVAKDPAMMRWLDTATSRRGKPNENFARELLELFTTGIGNYSEDDIKEAARAFTGWEIRNNQFFFNRAQFDAGSKSFLGQAGNLTGEDIINIAVSQPATARLVAAKLYQHFVDDQPQQTTITRLAAIFSSSGYEIKPVVRAILLSPEFLGESAFHAKVKSPIDYVVGLMKRFNLPVGLQQANVLSTLGQSLFNPPTVKGWPDGLEWLSASTFLARANFANQIVAGRDPLRRPWVDPVEIVQQRGLSRDDEIVDYFLTWLVAGDASTEFRNELLRYLRTGSRRLGRRGWDGRLRGVLHLIMASPVFQFK